MSAQYHPGKVEMLIDGRYTYQLFLIRLVPFWVIGLWAPIVYEYAVSSMCSLWLSVQICFTEMQIEN